MSKELAASGQLSAEQIKEAARELFTHYGWNNEHDNHMRRSIEVMRDMALSSLRGTFADGIEAAAKLADANGGLQIRWFASEIRALAQDQRESNSNPAPMHGQSKTGLTGSHPGAPTQDADELLREVRKAMRPSGYFDYSWYGELKAKIDAHLSRKELK